MHQVDAQEKLCIATVAIRLVRVVRPGGHIGTFDLNGDGVILARLDTFVHLGTRSH